MTERMYIGGLPVRIGDTVRLPKEFTMAMGSGEKERFRSFAERYVIERAGHWKPGEEDTGAWAAIQDAKRVYHQIALAGDDVQERIAEAVAHAARITNGLQAGNAAPIPSPTLLTPIPSPAMVKMANKTLSDPNTTPAMRERIKKFLTTGQIF